MEKHNPNKVGRRPNDDDDDENDRSIKTTGTPWKHPKNHPQDETDNHGSRTKMDDVTPADDRTCSESSSASETLSLNGNSQSIDDNDSCCEEELSRMDAAAIPPCFFWTELFNFYKNTTTNNNNNNNNNSSMTTNDKFLVVPSSSTGPEHTTNGVVGNTDDIDIPLVLQPFLGIQQIVSSSKTGSSRMTRSTTTEGVEEKKQQTFYRDDNSRSDSNNDDNTNIKTVSTTVPTNDDDDDDNHSNNHHTSINTNHKSIDNNHKSGDSQNNNGQNNDTYDQDKKETHVPAVGDGYNNQNGTCVNACATTIVPKTKVAAAAETTTTPTPTMQLLSHDTIKNEEVTGTLSLNSSSQHSSVSETASASSPTKCNKKKKDSNSKKKRNIVKLAARGVLNRLTGNNHSQSNKSNTNKKKNSRDSSCCSSNNDTTQNDESIVTDSSIRSTASSPNIPTREEGFSFSTTTEEEENEFNVHANGPINNHHEKDQNNVSLLLSVSANHPNQSASPSTLTSIVSLLQFMVQQNQQKLDLLQNESNSIKQRVVEIEKYMSEMIHENETMYETIRKLSALTTTTTTTTTTTCAEEVLLLLKQQLLQTLSNKNGIPKHRTAASLDSLNNITRTPFPSTINEIVASNSPSPRRLRTVSENNVSDYRTTNNNSDPLNITLASSYSSLQQQQQQMKESFLLLRVDNKKQSNNDDNNETEKENKAVMHHDIGNNNHTDKKSSTYDPSIVAVADADACSTITLSPVSTPTTRSSSVHVSEKKKSETLSYMRIHDLELNCCDDTTPNNNHDDDDKNKGKNQEMINKSTSSIPLSSSASSTINCDHGNQETNTKGFFYIDNNIITLLNTLYDFGYKIIMDEGNKSFIPATKETTRIVKQKQQQQQQPAFGVGQLWYKPPTTTSKDVLVWTRQLDNNNSNAANDTYNSYYDWPVVKGRGYIHTSAFKLLEFMWDSSQVTKYNKLNQGRKDLYVLQDLDKVHISSNDSAYGIDGSFKIVQSTNKHKLFPKYFETKVVMYAKPLELELEENEKEHDNNNNGGKSYIVVSRSVWENPSISTSMNSNSHNTIRTEIFLSVTIFRHINDNLCEMTTITHVYPGAGIPEVLAKRAAPTTASNMIRDIQSLFPPSRR